MRRTPAAWPSLLHHPVGEKQPKLASFNHLSSPSPGQAVDSLPKICGSQTRNSLPRWARGLVGRCTVPTNLRTTKQERGQQAAILHLKSLSTKGPLRHK